MDNRPRRGLDTTGKFDGGGPAKGPALPEGHGGGPPDRPDRALERS